MARSDGTVVIDTRMDTQGFASGAKDMQGMMGRLTNSVKGIGKALAAAFAVGVVTNFAKECIELGSDLEEVQNVVDVTFTTMSNDVNTFAKDAARSFGLSETMAKRYVGTFGAMSKSFGFTEEEAYNMSTALTGLAGDVASFYNLSQDEAYTKLKSVFTGETETLKELGVVMTQAALDQYALANGYGKTTKAMTEQEKVALRFAFVQQQLSAASGDFIRTSNSWANQVRIMQLQIQSLKATIGQGLINLFTPIIKVINTLLAKLATLANAFKAFTELITGNKSKNNGSSTISASANAYNTAADGSQNLADATENVADATKKAAKAANQYLSPLDEISRISDSTNYSIPSVGVGETTGSQIDYGQISEGENAIDDVTNSVSNLTEKLKELKEAFSKGFWDGLGDYKPIFVQLQNDIGSIKESLVDIFSSEEIGQSASGLANTITYTIGLTVGTYASIGLSMGSALIGGISDYLEENQEFIKRRIVTALDATSRIIGLAGNYVSAFGIVITGIFTSDSARSIAENIVGLFSSGFLAVLSLGLQFGADIIDAITTPFVDNAEAISTAINTGVLTPISTLLNTLYKSFLQTFSIIQGTYNDHIAPLFTSIKNGLTTIVGKLLESWNKHIAPVLNKLAKKASEVWNKHVQPVINKAIKLIGNVATLLQTLWENVIVPLIVWIVENVSPKVAPVLEAVGNAVLTLVATVSDSFSGILSILNGFVVFLTGVFSGDNEKAWEGIEEIVKGFETTINTIFNFVKTHILEPFLNWIDNTFGTDFSGSLDDIGLSAEDLLETIETVWEDVKAAFDEILKFINNVFSGNWSAAWEQIMSAVSDIFSGLADILKAPLNGAIGLINGLFGKINEGLEAIEKAFTFRIGFTNPITGTEHYSNFSLSLPSISSIPYLASGAVIPPRKEFLAVLGDQRNGTNIETPENLLRQIIQEELAGNNQGGGSYRFTAQINRRTLFDEMITEAKLRQMQTGRDPFAIA